MGSRVGEAGLALPKACRQQPAQNNQDFASQMITTARLECSVWHGISGQCQADVMPADQTCPSSLASTRSDMGPFVSFEEKSVAVAWL